MRSRERGQVIPLLAALVVVAGLAMIALAHLGGGAVDRAQARRAADAAALAGAADGRAGAEALANDNDASVSRFSTSGRDSEVVVKLGDARAIARARRDGGGVGTRPGDPSPALRAALARAAQIVGHKLATVRASGVSVTLTPDAYAEIAPRAAEAGLCASGPNEMRVCGAD